MDILYISPHYDDAIISCGGKIYSDVKEGHNVSVVTIFSEVKGPFSDYAKSLHSYWKLTDPFLERRNENINACKILGVENITLGLEDAIYRTFNSKFLYPNNGDIFRKINLHDKNIKNKIVDKIKKIATKDSTIYFPLGIGNHVDHVLAFRSGLQLRKEGYRIGFYMDFSYSGSIPTECNDMNQKKVKLTKEALDAKCNAVKKYASQLCMLFANPKNIKTYYVSKLKGEEVYYE